MSLTLRAKRIVLAGLAVVTALALLLSMTGCGSSSEPAAAVEDHEVVCLDENGNYADFANCNEFDDFDDYDDYEEHSDATTSNGFFLGFIAASMLNGKRPVIGQPAPAYARQLPARASLITPGGRLKPGQSLPKPPNTNVKPPKPASKNNVKPAPQDKNKAVAPVRQNAPAVKAPRAERAPASAPRAPRTTTRR